MGVKRSRFNDIMDKTAVAAVDAENGSPVRQNRRTNEFPTFARTNGAITAGTNPKRTSLKRSCTHSGDIARRNQPDSAVDSPLMHPITGRGNH